MFTLFTVLCYTLQATGMELNMSRSRPLQYLYRNTQETIEHLALIITSSSPPLEERRQSLGSLIECQALPSRSLLAADSRLPVNKVNFFPLLITTLRTRPRIVIGCHS
uniref:Uncharacterized protein n=1 Tax=Opuntia streptacantha TaxID=393608 RepID=A0A7C9CHB9_OPUST